MYSRLKCSGYVRKYDLLKRGMEANALDPFCPSGPLDPVDRSTPRPLRPLRPLRPWTFGPLDPSRSIDHSTLGPSGPSTSSPGPFAHRPLRPIDTFESLSLPRSHDPSALDPYRPREGPKSIHNVIEQNVAFGIDFWTCVHDFHTQLENPNQLFSLSSSFFSFCKALCISDPAPV